VAKTCKNGVARFQLLSRQMRVQDLRRRKGYILRKIKTGERVPEKINNTNKKNPKIMATKFICGFDPQYKLHKVCADDALRPVMGYLCFRSDNVYATDAHIAIAAPLSFVSNFDDDEKGLLEGKLIHATQFAQLLKMRETHIKETADGVQFECKKGAGETVIIPLLTEEALGKFPDVDGVLENARTYAKKNKQPISHIGLKPSLLADLTAAMHARIVGLYFSDASHAIIVKDADTSNRIRAILMPCIIKDQQF
jgi:hypothetical protein